MEAAQVAEVGGGGELATPSDAAPPWLACLTRPGRASVQVEALVAAFVAGGGRWPPPGTLLPHQRVEELLAQLKEHPGLAVATSRSVADALAKAWGAAVDDDNQVVGTDAAGGVLVYSRNLKRLLEDKQQSHGGLVLLLERSGLWQRLPGSCRGRILEHGEKLAAALALRNFHNAITSQTWASGAGVATSLPSGGHPRLAPEPVPRAHRSHGRRAGAAAGGTAAAGEAAQAGGVTAGEMLAQVAETAWQRDVEADPLLRSRDPVDCLYERVSRLDEGLFAAVPQTLDAAASSGAVDAATAWAQTSELMDALGVSMAAARHYRHQLERLYPAALAFAEAHELNDASAGSWEPWTASGPVRAAFRKLSHAGCRLLPDLRRTRTLSAPAALAESFAKVHAATEVLLECYREALSAAVGRGFLGNGGGAGGGSGSGSRRVPQQLLEEYRTLRDGDAMHCLLDFALDLRAGDARSGALLAVLATARQHCAFDVMAAALETLGDADMLYDSMANVVDPLSALGAGRSGTPDADGRFSTFIFERLVRSGHRSEVLQLPDELGEQVAAFLQPHWDLAWLHAVRLGRYADAVAALEKLGTAPQAGHGPGRPAARRRALSLAKIGRMAVGEPPASEAIRELERLLLLLRLVLPSGDGTGGGPTTVAPDEQPAGLSTAEMDDGQGDGREADAAEQVEAAVVAACRSRDAEEVLAAFEAAGIAGSAWRASHGGLLKSLWLAAARMDDWAQLQAERRRLGDDEYVRALAGTVLCRAVARTYGRGARPSAWRGEPLASVLPLGELLPLLQSAEAALAPHAGGQALADALELALQQTAT